MIRSILNEFITIANSSLMNLRGLHLEQNLMNLGISVLRKKNYDENLDSLIRDYGESFDTTYTVGSTIYRKHFQGKYFKSEHRDTCISEKSLATGTTKLTIKFAKSPMNHTVCKENRVLLESSATLQRLKVTQECKATFPRIDTYIYLDDGTLYAATRNFEGAEKSVLVLGSDSKSEIENNRKRCYAGL